MAALRIADLLPGFVIGLVAGVWIDRLRRRRVMIAADIGRALVLAAIPVMAFVGILHIAALVVVAAVASILTVFFDVAEQSYLPGLISREQLVEANSRLAATQSVAEISAFGLAGWLVQWFTAPIAIAIDAVTFLVSAGLIGSVRSAEPQRSSMRESANLWREMVDGLSALNTNRSLRALAVSLAAMEAAFGVVGTIYALFALRDLGFQPGLLGLVYAIGGISSLAASVFAGRINQRLGVGRAMVIGLILAACGILFMPLAHGAGIVALLLLIGQQLVGDGGATIFEINQVSLRQSLAPPDLLGRINAGSRFAALGGLLLGTVAGGVLGQAAGFRLTLVIGALLMLTGALAILRSPVVAGPAA